MYKIEYSLKVQEYLFEYFEYYRKYYEELYSDTWLWNEEQIIDWYVREAKNRKEEIIKLIEKNFSENEILWKSLENTIFLRWRTKYIFIEWKENKKSKIRYILKLEIR